MSASTRQLLAILRVSLKVDFRSRNPLGGGKRSRSSRALLMSLLFYFFIGSVLAGATSVGLPPLVRVATLLVFAGTYVAFNILVEYQAILLAPTDGDVLYWRPISSRTLFAARGLHILLYVSILTAALLAVPSVVIAVSAPGNFFAVWFAFWAAGLLNALTATSLTVLVYGVLLRNVSSERLQDVLAYVQVVMGVAVFLGYQMLGPALERFDFQEHPDRLAWFELLPAAWFGVLPAIVGWGSEAARPWLVVPALVVLGVTLVYALHRLAPSYETAMSLVAESEGRGAAVVPERAAPRAGGEPAAAPVLRGVHVPFGQRLFASWVARDTMRRAGFDFFLANLRGDRRIKVSLLPIVALPVAFVLFAVIRGDTANPYLTSDSTNAFAEAAGREMGSAAAGDSEDTNRSELRRERRRLRERLDSLRLADAPPVAIDSVLQRKRSVEEALERPATSHMLYVAAYFLAFFALTMSRSITTSPAWRAAWVFHAAPLRRFDRFYSGVLWGGMYGLVLPALLLLAVALLVMWRNPIHVLAHLAPPCGLAFIAFPIA
ncbi:MAG: hypothetical protein ACE5G2_10090, partial [Candidatus Krumholzibacteriia bacterium]